MRIMGFFDLFIDYMSDYMNTLIMTDGDLGKYGESLTEVELKKAKLWGYEGKILRNVYVPKENGETTEIDVIFLCQKGILVIESKNYSGWIFGNEDDAQWTATLPDGTRNHFYNPIKQNKSHMKWLGRYLNMMELPAFSIIAFSERCTLKKITVRSGRLYVVNRDMLKNAIRNIWTYPDCLSEEKIEELYQRLEPLTRMDQATRKAHLENIKSKNYEMRCPKCGSMLVLRTAKNGVNAGKQFYGCSGFPNCRYVRNS